MITSHRKRSRVLEQFPSLGFFKSLTIGAKLRLGFFVMIALTLIVVGISYVASQIATERINTTTNTRAPVTLIASQAQANLLRMLASSRGYLALGDSAFRDDYFRYETDFTANLARLDSFSQNLSAADVARVDELQRLASELQPLPPRLFALRDDQLEREPAYRTLATQGVALAGQILIDSQKLIDSQANRDATQESFATLRNMARFQGSFSALLSGLRGYVTTRNRVFRSEYEANLSINTLAWNDLLRARDRLDEPQKTLLDSMQTNREQFLMLVPGILSDLEGPRWREDLYLFANDALPITNRMGAILDELTSSQQSALAQDLSQGSQDLNITNQRNLAIGGVALVVGLVLAALFAANISGPVGRLTLVAEAIEGGNLDARAKPESRDEIGTLAETFNAMADQIRTNLVQIRAEKKRADDLLDVVIPIGVSLTGERDFNRLLENMLVQAKEFCRARAGTLYLREGDLLRYVIMRNDAMNLAQGGTTGNAISFPPLQLLAPDGTPNYENVATYAAHKEITVNLPDVNMQTDPDFPGPRAFNTAYGYSTTSFLTIPLRSNTGQMLGVLQLIDAVDPNTAQVIPFDINLQRMMESFSSLAVAALEAYIREQGLRAQIQQLHIEIDEAKRQRAVSEIVDSDFFQGLQAKARETRRRARDRMGDQPEQPEQAEATRRTPDDEPAQS